MSRGRGIQCSDCDLKVDRSDDSIECLSCKNEFHSKCVFPSMEIYLKLRDEKKLNQWICEACIRRSISSETDVLTHQNLDDSVGTRIRENSNPEPNLSCQQSVNGCLNKNDLLKLKQEIVEDVTRLFSSEIVSLKEMLVAQEKLIRKLISENNELKRRENVFKTNKSGNEKPHGRPVINSGILSASPHANSAVRVSPSDPCSANFMQEKKIMNDLIYIEKDVGSANNAKSAGTRSQSDWTLVKSKRGVKSNKPPVKSMDTVDGKSISPQKLQADSGKLYKPVVGTMKSKSLVTVPKKRLALIHVSRLSPTTNIEDLEKYVGSSIPGISCEKLNSRRPDIYSSFKIAIPFESLDQVMNPSFWPEGAAVKRFFLKRRLDATLT